MKKPMVKSINFIKAICALGIITYHFSSHLTNTDFRPFWGFANGAWGPVFVAVFFMVSGGALYYNYSDNLHVSTFYKKRWLSIFPMFYLAYFSFEIGHVINTGSIFFRGNPLRYIYTLLGMDGYLHSVVTTYYNLGEWFLGAIIILYIMFPAILSIFNKNDKVVLSIILIVYVIFYDKPLINPVAYCSILSCLISFVFGMAVIKYRRNIVNTKGFILSFLGCLILTFVKIPFPTDISVHLFGGFLMIFLMRVGDIIMKKHFLDVFFTELSRISYAVFLLHHVVIVKILNGWNVNSGSKVLAVLAGTIVIILCEAKMLTVVNDSVIGYFKRRKI